MSSVKRVLYPDAPSGLLKRAAATVFALAQPGVALSTCTLPLLLNLNAETPLVRAVLVRRPSERNRSPFVADVRLPDGRVALAHVPSMDLGGKCVAGSTLLLKEAVDRKGVAVGANGVSPKYGTPKCEFIAQLVHHADSSDSSGVWVGAHPGLGERLAEAMITDKHLDRFFHNGPVLSYNREVKGIAGDDSRADFVLTHSGSGSDCKNNEAALQALQHRTVLEVKTVVDTDVAADDVSITLSSGVGDGVVVEEGAASEPKKKKIKAAPKKNCIFISYEKPYVRHAIFPWGRSAQTYPGEAGKVVSARAIKHLDELAALARGDRVGNRLCEAGSGGGSESREHQSKALEGVKAVGAGGGSGSGGERLGACVLFVVTRGDALAFRPNHEACPAFARHLSTAHNDGVLVLAHKVTWGEGTDEGKAFYSGELPVVFTTA